MLSSTARLATAVCVAVVVLVSVGLLPETADARPRPCGTVGIVPNTDNGLFKILAGNLSCSAAKQILRDWAQRDYEPRNGPEGFTCRVVRRGVVGNARVRCVRAVAGQGQSISFTTGF